MSTKLVNFLTTIWFASAFICVILEGSFFGTREGSIIQNLSLFSWYNIGNLFSIPVLNLNFFQGLLQLLTWDYSFYTGWYTILRWFWTAVLSPGAVWGIIQLSIYLYGQLISLFRLLPLAI